MGADRFDTLARSLTSHGATRRHLVNTLAGGVLAGLAVALGLADAGAAHFGCLHVGKSCTRAGQCCSGRCRGPQGKKTCRAHHTGGCTRAQDYCQTNDLGESQCPANPAGLCRITTGNAPFCANTLGGGCEFCKTDRDCVEKRGYPPGSACIHYGPGPTGCDCGLTNDTGCLIPAV